jgi:hypothetical protein
MKKVIVFCCALMTAAAMQAQIIHVPGDYPTIQQGITAAIPGDTVLVDEGIYYEQINFLGKKPLTVASQFLMDGDSTHIANTVIDGSQISNPDSATVVFFVSGEDTTSVLCGFTIQGGKGTVFNLPGYTIRDGGGIFLSLSGAKIIHNHITENHLSDTAASPTDYVYGGGIGTAGEECNVWVILDHNAIDHNSCYGSGDQVGSAGMDMWYNARITNNIIAWNTLTGVSGSSAVAAGLCCVSDSSWAVPGSVVVKNNILSDNLVQASNNYATGGGALFQSVNSWIEGNVIRDNQSITWSYSGGVGGIYIYAPLEQTVIQGNMFTGNLSNLWTGALGVEPVYGDPDPELIIVENNYFLGNEAKNGGGLTSTGNPVVLENNVFSDNHAIQDGGAVYLEITKNLVHPAKLINNSFYGNHADVYGGAVYSRFIKNLLVINSVFWKDTSNSLSGQEIYIANMNDTLEIANSDFDPTLVRGVIVDGGGNISQDPLYEDLSLLRINGNSPCFNTGTDQYTCLCGMNHQCPAYDITGMPRPLYGLYDMGAVEGVMVGVRDLVDAASAVCRVYPNPFRHSTTFEFELSTSSTVTIRIYNTFGQLIAEPVNSVQSKGECKVSWYASGLPAGVYYYRIDAGKMTESGKVVKME